MTLNDEDKIILYDYGNKDYKAQVAAAKSFQDIVNVFEVCFPGTADKHKDFTERSDKLLSALETIQSPGAKAEQKYEALKQWTSVNGKIPILDVAGIDYDKAMDAAGSLRISLPEKLLDSYILEAGMMLHTVDKVAVKEELYAEKVKALNAAQTAIIEKYTPHEKEAEAKVKLVTDAYLAWDKQQSLDRLNVPDRDREAFEEAYRELLSDWQRKLMAAHEEFMKPVSAMRNNEFASLNDGLVAEVQALKQELSTAKEQAYNQVIDSILATSTVSEQQAAEWSKGNVIYDKSAMAKSAKDGYTKKEIERDVLLFYRLTGGRLPRLEFTTTRKARSAAAHWSGELFIGHNFGRRTLWHEMAHLLEDDPKIKAAAIAFRDRRRDDAELHRLKDLVPGSNYDSNEVAYKDSWLDPYIGKDYGQTATEVVSMGMQQLASVPMLFELHEKDPEHLAFMLGLCMTKPVIDTEDIAKKQARTQEKAAKASKVENLQKELDKQVAKAGDFWSKDGINIVTEKQWSYKSRKYVERAEIRYNIKMNEDGTLNSYNNYTVKNEKAAKRALFVWYKAGKPSGQGSGDFNLGNIVYQFEHSKGMNWPMVDFALNQPQSVGV